MLNFKIFQERKKNPFYCKKVDFTALFVVRRIEGIHLIFPNS